jgi:hypothetical protein
VADDRAHKPGETAAAAAAELIKAEPQVRSGMAMRWLG